MFHVGTALTHDSGDRGELWVERLCLVAGAITSPLEGLGKALKNLLSPYEGILAGL